MAGPEQEEPWRRRERDRDESVPGWWMQQIQTQVNRLGEHGDKLHRENQEILNELTAQTRVLTRVVDDMRKDLEEAKKQNVQLMRAIVALAMVVIVAFVSWVFDGYGGHLGGAHAETPAESDNHR